MDFLFLVHNFKVCSRISVAGSMSTHDLAAHAHDGCLRCVESMSKRTRLKHAFRQQMDGRADVVSRVGWGGHVVWVGVWLSMCMVGWTKDINNIKGTQEVFDHRAKMCTLAAQGKWSESLENSK